MRDNKTYQNFKVTQAPSVTLRVPPSSRRKAFLLTPLYHKSAEKTSSLPTFCAYEFSVKDNREMISGAFLVAEVGFERPTRKYSRLARVRVARFRCSLFSPLSRSLPLAPRAVALQARAFLLRKTALKSTVPFFAKTKGHLTVSFCFGGDGEI